ncbi:unnamed protein product [Hymenolepis diminuta]|uniref:Cystinosin homolog n=1 Tax=Hymenolepis diminuta TaxID=6216 RepID=A0A564Z7T2_HYMDI|nr:unnamed protein product [Hymenolepis diminuta]
MHYLLILIYISTAYSEEVTCHKRKGSSIGISIGPSNIEIELNQTAKVFVHFTQPLSNRTRFAFTYRDASGRYYITSKKLPIKPLESFTVKPDSNITYEASIFTNKPGILKLGITSTSFNVSDLDLIHTSITVYRFKLLTALQQIVGWTYFLAWTLSFYPQIILNCRRKSVEGLSFDFIVYNVIGFLCYSIFNIGLYFIPLIQEEYFNIYPLGVIPVQLNDLFFSVHALVITLVVVVQCFLYERGTQKVSMLCKLITILMLIFIAFSGMLATFNCITWLSAFYLFSYVKLIVTLIKYVPQISRTVIFHLPIGHFELSST